MQSVPRMKRAFAGNAGTRWSILVFLVAIACGSKSSGGVRTFKLSVVGEDTPVAVQLAVPSSWSEDTTSTQAEPRWTMAGARLLSLAAISPRGDDAATRMSKAIKMQYGDAAGVERVDLPEGRVWMVQHEGENIHARMFVPFDRGVVMGVAILAQDGAGQLPVIKQAFDTLKTVAP